MRRALLVGLLLMGRMAAAQPAIPVEQYRAKLQGAATRLRAMENASQRPLAPLLNNLSADKQVRRADGTLQSAGGDEWRRRAIDAPNRATREQVRAARSSIEARLQELGEWGRQGAQGAYFASADAQTRFNQIKNSGAIRTGPTAVEAWWSRTRKAIGDLWDRLMKWLFAKTPMPSSRVPQVSPLWIQALFWTAVLALLGVVGFFVWRAVGDPFAHRAARKVESDFGEDEALLRLPPDELLERARAFARAGDFREALRHIYIRLLLQLDARGVWRYDARRTNWEHIELLRRHQSHAALAAPLADLTRRFDRVRYGDAPCAAEDWNRFEQDAFAVENAAGSKP